jgi:hypothetical protein
MPNGSSVVNKVLLLAHVATDKNMFEAFSPLNYFVILGHI